jgi:hypothetical protein
MVYQSQKWEKERASEGFSMYGMSAEEFKPNIRGSDI